MMRPARTAQALALVVSLALVFAVAPATADDRGDQRTGGLKGTGTTMKAAEASIDSWRFSTSGRELHYGSPREADLVGKHLAAASADLSRYLQPSTEHPLYAGGVVLAARNGVIALHESAGKAVRYEDADTELPADQQVPARRDTIFDLASLTKTFTSIAVMQQVEAGRVELDQPVASYLPDFAQMGKGGITVRHLLTHTGGLPAWLPLYSAYDTVEERFAAVLAAKPIAAPGQKYLYSDLSLITLGLIVEKVTGRPLDTVIAKGITEPLGMSDTMFNPPAALRPRIAATEAQPWAGRPMIIGEVHDENAWSLGGIAGHAGVFSTAHDLAVLAQTLLNGGRHGGTRILDSDTVRAMITNENTTFPGNAHGLGFELDQRWYMDALSSPATFGHTGFTGTSLVVDPLSRSFVILLTNRVHPSRDWGSVNPARRAVARDLARAVAVAPAEGRTAWYAGLADSRSVTLTAPIAPRTAGVATVDFDLWYDTEAGHDIATFETSTDGGETWKAVPFTIRDDGHQTVTNGTVSGFGGRVWHAATALLDVPAGEQLVRWRYDTDSANLGRGVYLDGIRVHGPDGRRLDQAGLFRSEGWELTSD